MPDSHDGLTAPPGIARYLRDPVLIGLCIVVVLSYVVGATDFDAWVHGYPRWPVILQTLMVPVHFGALGAIFWRLGLRIWWIVALVAAAVYIEARFLHSAGLFFIVFFGLYWLHPYAP